jgi:hypothetical protein
MITVTVFEKQEKIVGVQLEGHAEFGKKGKDIVCSAVSILYINLVNSLESFTSEEKELNGSSKINFQNVILKNMPGEKAELLFQSFLLGITTIEQKYGKKYIVILNQEV